MPQVQPTEVSAFAHNATSLNVTWQPIEPTRENIRGKLIGYRVIMKDRIGEGGRRVRKEV